jgi:uncharacterized protein DUF547
MKVRFIRATLAAALLALAASPAAADLAPATVTYGKLLSQYVTPRGVKYDAWRSNGADLKSLSEVVMLYRSTDPKTLAPDERKALYINLYNVKIVETVLLGNPTGSIKELSKGLSPLEIFSRAALNFDQKTISLNDLEKRLREEFKDPRIHFALNCASRSCPPIDPEPYVAADLDARLDDATRRFLASPGAVETKTDGGRTKIVTVRIFEWYADDFKASGGALAFIQKFGPEAAADAIAGGKAKIEFADYDWSLNAAK